MGLPPLNKRARQSPTLPTNSFPFRISEQIPVNPDSNMCQCYTYDTTIRLNTVIVLNIYLMHKCLSKTE